MLDLTPATRELTRIVEGVRDDQMSDPTPCRDVSVGDLLEHVDGLCLAFSAAARKNPLPPAVGRSFADVARLSPGWRNRIPERLAELAGAWRVEDAWAGSTQAGGVELPGEVAGLVALDEVVVHGWDLAVATGQEFTCDPDLLEALYGFVQSAVARNPQGGDGLFGPPVPVPDGAPLMDRIIGLTGRDPALRLGAPHARPA